MHRIRISSEAGRVVVLSAMTMGRSDVLDSGLDPAKTEAWFRAGRDAFPHSWAMNRLSPALPCLHLPT